MRLVWVVIPLVLVVSMIGIIGMQESFAQYLTQPEVDQIKQFEEVVDGMPSETILIPSGAATPDCQETNECFIPSKVTIAVGDIVEWSNDDSATHTVFSGIPPAKTDNIKFKSGMIIPGQTFSLLFDEVGEYSYFCLVYP